MLNACRTFLTARLEELTLPDGYTTPYRSAEPGACIFFYELPHDFLKDNDYAACCLPLQDRAKKNGKLIAKTRTLAVEVEGEPTVPAKYDLTRRRFTREILFRCLIYAPTADELAGLVDQFIQGVAGHKVIAASDDSAIRIEPQDSARPWDSGVEMERKLRRPRLAIIRVLFSGGVQVTETMGIIPSVTITPQVQNP